MVGNISLFPGQGAQYEKMGLDLFDTYDEVKELFTLASDTSGLDVHRLLSEGTLEEITATEKAQVLITLVNLSAAKVLKRKGATVTATAGFSLGELTSYAVSGVIDDEQLFRLVTRRGALMGQYGNEAAKRFGALSMAAVIGLSFDRVQGIISGSNVDHLYAANDNGPAQVVISGLAASMEAVTAALKEAGARRVIPIQVSGPFHTPLMQEAREAFDADLGAVRFNDPTIALYSNVSGEPVSNGNQVKELCSQQIVSPVRWTKIMNHLASGYPDLPVVETGPNKVLSGLMRSVGVKCLQAGTVESIESTLKDIQADE
ncbi:MAG: ACP S-malonyltransferase [Sphaerochaetaceae bacterium]|nr:ACP S-malonyltransferase [Sphaerochaetaceae bacterium]